MSSHGSYPGSAPYPRSPPPALSSLRVCLDQTPTLLSTQFTILSTQLTLLLQSFTDTPPPHSLPHSESSSRSSNRLLCHLPPSAFPARPHTHSVSSYAGSVGVLYHPSLYTLVPLSRAKEQCPRTQKEGGRWNLLFLPAPPGGARALCLPSALSGCA